MSQTEKNEFTWGLALADMIPVLFFAGNLIVIATKFVNGLFILGGVLCIFAGLGKVVWKIIRAISGKDVKFFFYQFRVTMPSGFLLLLGSVLWKRAEINWPMVWAAVSSLPAIIFFVLTIVAMIVLFVMGAKLDRHNAKHNWIEQGMNILMQALVFFGVLSAVLY